MATEAAPYQPKNRIRIVTATALFDGHDAAINIIRRMLQGTGAEVIHLGHNRSVEDVVGAAIEEGAHAISVSSYQGGHIEFFKYMLDLLKERNAPHIKVFGGGGGVIIPSEIEELEAYGVSKIYSPEDGNRWGLQGIINHLMKTVDDDFPQAKLPKASELNPENKNAISSLISVAEAGKSHPEFQSLMHMAQVESAKTRAPILGITGTGGAGKSSLTDELVLRMLHDLPTVHVAIVSCDPSRRRTGGALLGDRIRMNSLGNPRIYMRSLATRKSHTEIPENLSQILQVVATAGFDLVIVETAGIGQGDSSITDIVDVSMYVMTSEFGASSQLEKIDMLDFADLVVVNKFEKRGSEDAVRDVRKQVQRNRGEFHTATTDMPVFGTIASKFNDDGVTALYKGLLDAIQKKTGKVFNSTLQTPEGKTSSSKTIIIPPERVRYLSEISECVRNYHAHTEGQAGAIRKHWHLEKALNDLKGKSRDELLSDLKAEAELSRKAIDAEAEQLLEQWNENKEKYTQDELVYNVRGREFRVPLVSQSLSRTRIPKVALPGFDDPGELYKWMRRENIPGNFPFTAGVFPLKRVDEDPTRMFAGEGDPARTNRRFKLLSGNYDAKRLSTAFDSVTLYGYDPDERPDIYGKVGTSGVSVCTLDDVKVLYDGFDLCSPKNSVSMTINGPAPIILAMFLNTAIDQQIEAYKKESGQEPDAAKLKELADKALCSVRGTVQADILKEDQGQNTCIFSTDFALRMMGDVQEYFNQHDVRNFYSVSISGYHIAEAGANPISQTAFTMANGFTYVEYYRSRGMDLNRFGPNLSFFFSNGMDPEYTVIGRVARRIWAIAMRDLYKASERTQKLKYHIQTSGRSLHSQDIQFNDIRTTLQALCAIYDNCNSLHTNAYDEAITTPSEESVRRALAIQLIVNREWGLAKNENPYQGAFIVDYLTNLVEEAVLSEFDSITERGGVLGAMETGYQRGKIQEESIYYETLKHTGQFPIIGVNAFMGKGNDNVGDCIELARATEDEKESQLNRLRAFQHQNQDKTEEALKKLQHVALTGGNIFTELMQTVRICSLGQITKALFDVGGQYRRNM